MEPKVYGLSGLPAGDDVIFVSYPHWLTGFQLMDLLDNEGL